MTDYLSALRRRLDTHPPDLGDADSVLNLLYEAYSECNPMADAQIKAGFHELYQLMNGVPLEKMDEIIKHGDKIKQLFVSNSIYIPEPILRRFPSIRLPFLCLLRFIF